MSGHDLREAAKNNEVEVVRYLCLRKSNPCSVDAHGLSPLHYAVWNGNLECVKYLVMNPRGVTKQGVRCPCLNLQSNMGLSALHLAALECPVDLSAEITTVLLISGVDTKLRDKNGNTAHDLAQQRNNSSFLLAWNSYVEAVRDGVGIDKFRNLLAKLKKDYCLHILPQDRVKSRDEVHGDSMIDAVQRYFSLHDEIAAFVEHESLSASFTAWKKERDRNALNKLRRLLDTEKRAGQIPSGAAIPEHLIRAVAEYGFHHEKKTIPSLKTLQFAADQAKFYAEHRLKVMQSKGEEFVEFPLYLPL